MTPTRSATATAAPPPPRRATRRLLGPADVPPSRPGFEVIGTFNPAAWRDPDGRIRLLVRVAERPADAAAAHADGHLLLPRYALPPVDDPAPPAAFGHGPAHPPAPVIIDRARADDWDRTDERTPTHRSTGRQRTTFISHLRHVELHEDLSVARVGPPIEPAAPLTDADAAFGLEDPRVTLADDRLYATVVTAGFSGVSTRGWTSDDRGRTWTDRGVWFCRENKDVVVFPERRDGHLLALHRPTGTFAPTAPQMWLARSPDATHWGGHAPLHLHAARVSTLTDATPAWAAARTGGGAPPLRTPHGWLTVYHAAGVPRPADGAFAGRYVAAAALLDADDPRRVRAVATAPLLVPEADFERQGFVPEVVFPTAAWTDGDELVLIYGAADTACGLTRVALSDVWRQLGVG